jgi:hypothetical protein
MPKRSQPVELNKFQKGLITEASLLESPIGSTRTEKNFTINSDGSRQRRLGVNFETSYEYNSVGEFDDTDFTNLQAYNSHIWKNVAGRSDVSVVAVQSGPSLTFYRVIDEISPNYISRIDVSIGGSVSLTQQQFGFSDVNGFLIIATGEERLLKIEATFDANDVISLAASFVTLRIRDLFGVEDLDGTYDLRSDNEIGRSPTSLTDPHRYNLRNQSYAISRWNRTWGFTDPVNTHFNVTGTYPSNAMNMWQGIEGSLSGTDYVEFYHPEWMTSSKKGILERK